MKIDYYEILGVSRDCDDKALKAAFRKLAKQYHPDRNPGCATSEKMFKDIAQAYEVLKDPSKRAAYDRYGHQAFENGFSGNNPFQDFTASRFRDVFEDIFGDVGGSWNRGRSRSERGGDISHKITITLEDAYVGKSVEIKVPTLVFCEVCKGTGCSGECQYKLCTTCQGAGRVRVMHGFLALERTCTSCQGRGEIISNPCDNCKGSGQISQERVLSINVPAGIEDETRIRLAGEGEAGRNGGPPGDLYVFVTIMPHNFFQRDEENLYCTIPISMTTAALGGEFAVTTLDKVKTKVKVPESVQTGRKFRLKGKGMPILRSQAKGDLYIQVVVETPQNLTKKQKELLEAFAKEAGEERTSPQAHGFFSKMKDFFENISPIS